MSQDDSSRIVTAEVKPVLPDPRDDAGSVDAALARALDAAAAAGRFDVVAQLARELEARRLASSNGRVVALNAARDHGRK